MRNLRVALSFLTRVPVPIPADPDLSAAVPWYPAVGALVGLAVGAAAAGLVQIVPALVAAAFAVLFGVLITGAFHEDGLADVADAFAGGWTRAERLQILKDPLHGSYGVAALCGSIVVRVGSLASLGVSPAAAFAGSVAAHTMGRCAAVAVLVAAPSANPDGLGGVSASNVGRWRAALGVVGGVALVTLVSGWWVVAFAVAALVGAGAVGWLAMRKIAGVTGDVLGAAEQVVECLVLATATGLASRSALWWA